MWREEKIGANENGEKAAAGDIELRDVTFRYLGADEDTLHSLNMTIKQGEKIAIVGFNGAGKNHACKAAYASLRSKFRRNIAERTEYKGI